MQVNTLYSYEKKIVDTRKKGEDGMSHLCKILPPALLYISFNNYTTKPVRREKLPSFCFDELQWLA